MRKPRREGVAPGPFWGGESPSSRRCPVMGPAAAPGSGATDVLHLYRLLRRFFTDFHTLDLADPDMCPGPTAVQRAAVPVHFFSTPLQGSRPCVWKPVVFFGDGFRFPSYPLISPTSLSLPIMYDGILLGQKIGVPETVHCLVRKGFFLCGPCFVINPKIAPTPLGEVTSFGGTLYFTREGVLFWGG